MGKVRITLILSALGLVGAANASSLFTYHGLVSEMSKSVNISFNGKSMTVGAGLAMISLNGGSKFGGMCVDLEHFNSNGSSYQVNVKPIAERGPTANRAAWLFAQNANKITSKDMGAALQLAIWDVLYDGGDGLSSGKLKSSVTGNVKTLTNNLLTSSKSKSGDAWYFQALSHGYKNDKNQDYMSTVPEPATMATLAVGALALTRRRRRNA